MTKRKMFLRMITASLLRRRSRMLIALLSIGIGATILAGLVTIYVDVPRQMGAQFRSYGANMLLLPRNDAVLNSEILAEALKKIPENELIGATPYRYVRLDMTSRQQSFTAAGTDFSQVPKTSPYFSVEGAYPEKNREILVGKSIADTIGVKTGSTMELTYQPAASAEEFSPEESRLPGSSLSGSAEGELCGVAIILFPDRKCNEISEQNLLKTRRFPKSIMDIYGRDQGSHQSTCFDGKRRRSGGRRQPCRCRWQRKAGLPFRSGRKMQGKA